MSSLPNINWLKYILTVGKIYRFNRLWLKAIFRENGLKTGLELVWVKAT